MKVWFYAQGTPKYKVFVINFAVRIQSNVKLHESLRQRLTLLPSLLKASSLRQTVRAIFLLQIEYDLSVTWLFKSLVSKLKSWFVINVYTICLKTKGITLLFPNL